MKRSQMEVHLLDDLSDVQELGRQVHDGIMTLFHNDGHNRDLVRERADHRKKKPTVHSEWKPGTDDIDADTLLGKDECDESGG